MLKEDKYYSSFISQSCLLTPQTVVKPVKGLASKWKIKIQETIKGFHYYNYFEMNATF